MIRDCDHFKDLLVDLAYDEANEETRAALEAHAHDCADCRSELDSILLTRKMFAQLPEEILPELADDTILKMAEAAASEFSSTRDDSRVSIETNLGLGNDINAFERKPNFFESIRGWLLRPALVTAAVASVAFVVAVFIDKNASDPNDYLQRDYSGAPFMGPSSPAKSRQTPILADMAEPAAADEKSVENEVAAETVAQASERRRESFDFGAGVGKAYATKGGLGTTGPVPKNPADKFDGDAPSLSKAEEAPGLQTAMPAPAPNNNSELFDSLAKGRGADFMEEAEMPAKQEKKAKSSPSSDGSGEIITSDETAYQLGRDAFNRGDCVSAGNFFQQVVSQPITAPGRVASSLHHLAKCEKRTGRCGKAVLYYERLLKNYSLYIERSEAMWETAACHRRLGHIDRAKELLNQLSQDPQWSAKADEELSTLEQLEQK